MGTYRTVKGDPALLEMFELFIAPFIETYKATHDQATDSEAFAAFWGEGDRKILWAKVLKDTSIPGEALHYHNKIGVRARRQATVDDDLLIRVDKREPGFVDVSLLPEGLDEEHCFRLDSRAYTQFLSNVRVIK